MIIAYYIVLVATIAANLGIAIADFASARFVLNNSAKVRVPRSWLPILGALKATGALGLLFGLLGVPTIDTFAAAGLTAFFIGAMWAHVRAREIRTIAGPAAYLALAVASLLLSLVV